MVKGLEIFRNHFADFSGSYVMSGHHIVMALVFLL